MKFVKRLMSRLFPKKEVTLIPWLCMYCDENYITSGQFCGSCLDIMDEAQRHAVDSIVEPNYPLYWTCDLCGRDNHVNFYPCDYCGCDEKEAAMIRERLSILNEVTECD